MASQKTYYLKSAMARPPLEALLVVLVVMAAVRLAAASDISNVERDALRAFRAGVSDPRGKLRSWNTTAHFCRWEGVNCTGGHVTKLSMESFGLVGTISPAVGNLTYLEDLILNRNSLSGSIPASLGRLRRLVYLGLCDNAGLTGEIPDSLRNCTGLIYIYLNNNGFTGDIPAWLGTFPNLTNLWLYNNSFTGEIPASFGNLTKLITLGLQQNHLRGALPDGLSRLPLLQVLNVYQNQFSGGIPAGFFHMPSLEAIYLANNEFTGSLPPDAGTGMTNLTSLLLGGNRLTGPIPASLANASAMEVLSLSNNSFTGRVPREIGALCLNVLEMSNNELTATDDVGGGWEFVDGLTKCGRLRALKLDGNRLSGTMPTSIVNFSRNLTELTLGSNRISGSIPPGIGNLAALMTLGLESNLLAGAIPASIGKLKNLTELRLQGNKLTGPVPSAVGDLTNLLKLVLSDNTLSGSIPPTLGDLQKVTLLNLSGNMLTGEVPRQLFRMASLSVAMDLSRNRLDGLIPLDVSSLRNLALLKLSENRFSGEIPKQLGDCQSLEFLDLDNNFLTGDIPASLSMLRGLRSLNLTSNRLSGSIPPELGRMSGLQELDLSRNNLTGAVPEELANMTSLIELDLSYNQLAGSVPLRGVFANMTGFNITGNGELCGGDPMLHLPRCPVSGQARRHARWWFLQIVVPILSVALLSSTLFAIFLCYKMKSKPAQATAISDELDGGKNYQRISYGELAKATNGFASTNLIGQGKFGTVYLGILPLQMKGAPPEDVAVAVKVFNLRQVGASKTFLSECEALRSIRHRNLVSIVTCCSSIDASGDDFRALVFELMPNYSLDRWLHRKPESVEKFGGLSAVQRLNIAVDIADALSYLHHGCVPPMVHCDLKPSNVLLGKDMTAFIGDFGLAKLLLDDPGIHGAGNSESTIGIRGTIGYVAPEYGTTGKVSTYGDAYSFGITILEIFSGRSPTDDAFVDGLTLHGLVAAAFPDEVDQVLDAALLPSTKKAEVDHGSEQSGDGDGGGRRATVHECLVSAVRVGLSCARTVPHERMNMKDAAAELRAIRDALCSCLATAGSRAGADEDEDEAAAAV